MAANVVDNMKYAMIKVTLEMNRRSNILHAIKDAIDSAVLAIS